MQPHGSPQLTCLQKLVVLQDMQPNATVADCNIRDYLDNTDHSFLTGGLRSL